jgi:hypothetical protein
MTDYEVIIRGDYNITNLIIQSENATITVNDVLITDTTISDNDNIDINIL